jgi:cellulose synthase/poly-beta-1,6-N-acetylglucosamine synthase-like glycosyltransferase
MKPFQPDSSGGSTRISVVIVVRNEADNIVRLLEDLDRQSYPAPLFEVIIADDGSTDETFGLVEQYRNRARYALNIFSLPADSTTLSPKKKGITEAIARARGELIVHTDGDCRVSASWLKLLENAYRSQQACLISGAVTFTEESTLLEKMQTIEFASLSGSGACALSWGFPTMCNGANLAYPKAVFEAVGGFSGIDHLASGDDELLMHKIARRYPGRLFFLKHPDSVVHTRAQATLGALYQQRKRWASKWDAYQDPKISMLAVFVFLSNAGLLLAAALTVLGWYPFSAFILQALVKLLVEFLPLSCFIAYLQTPALAFRRILLIPLVQVVYPFYVSFFGLAAQRKGFEWKGRKLNK